MPPDQQKPTTPVNTSPAQPQPEVRTVSPVVSPTGTVNQNPQLKSNITFVLEDPSDKYVHNSVLSYDGSSVTVTDLDNNKLLQVPVSDITKVKVRMISNILLISTKTTPTARVTFLLTGNLAKFSLLSHMSPFWEATIGQKIERQSGIYDWLDLFRSKGVQVKDLWSARHWAKQLLVCSVFIVLLIAALLVMTAVAIHTSGGQ